MKQFTFYLCCILGIAFSLISCEELIKIPTSQNQLEAATVFSDSASATAAATSIYTYFSSSVYNGSKNLALYADDYRYMATVPGTLEYYESRLSADNRNNASFWNNLYFIIYQCNAVIEQADASNVLSESLKAQLQSEAKFLRAYAYFTLVNLYDNIPLVLSTDVDINARMAQVPGTAVYDQMVEDLIGAKAGLSETYIGTGKVRANSWAASALLSRVYLHLEEWERAEEEATAIIGRGLYAPLTTPEDLFLANSREAILQFWTQNGRVSDATQLIPSSASARPSYSISPELYDFFGPDDDRRKYWIGTNTVMENGNPVEYHYFFKYKNRAADTAQPEYAMALRLSEQYLIRAEARARQNNLPGAIRDINVIRARAGISPLPDRLSTEETLEAVQNERRKEFFGEWGMRFMDLKRTGKLNEVLGALKGTWREGTAERLPIPRSETIYNNHLIPNHGY